MESIQKNIGKIYLVFWLLIIFSYFILSYFLDQNFQYTLEKLCRFQNLFGFLILFIYGYFAILKKYKYVILFLFLTSILIGFQAYITVYSQGYDIHHLTNSTLLEISFYLLIFPLSFIDTTINIGYDSTSSLDIKFKEPRFSLLVSYIIYFIYLSIGALYSIYGDKPIKIQKNTLLKSDISNNSSVFAWSILIFILLFVSSFSAIGFANNFFLYLYQVATVWVFGYTFIIALFMLVYFNKFKIFYSIFGIGIVNTFILWLGIKNILTVSIYTITVIFPFYTCNFILNIIYGFYYSVISSHYHSFIMFKGPEYIFYGIILLALLSYSFIKLYRIKKTSNR